MNERRGCSQKKGGAILILKSSFAVIPEDPWNLRREAERAL